MKSRWMPLIVLCLLTCLFLFFAATKPEVVHLPILMYHHVVSSVPEGESVCNDMTITTEQLESDLQWISEHGYHTILPRELASGMPLPEKPVLITFDDGYRSNYELAYPLIQKYQIKAAISLIVYMPDNWVDEFLSWDMCREMEQSGLIEIGSHSYQLHNLGAREGRFEPDGINGIQRIPEESSSDFQARVLQDIQQSYQAIAENLGHPPVFFTYPFGITEPDAEDFINALFPVTAVTGLGRHRADLSRGLHQLPRYSMTMDHSAKSVLQPSLIRICKNIVKDLLGI